MAKKKVVLTHEQKEKEVMKAHAGSVWQRMKEPLIVPMETCTTGSLMLDAAIEAGGWLLRGISENWGRPSIGKTTLNLSGAAQNSRIGKVYYLDTELRIPPGYAKSIVVANGGDLDNFVLIRPESGIAALDIAESLIGWARAIYIDTIAKVKPPKMQNPTDSDQVFMGSQSKFVGDGLDRMGYNLGRSGIGKRNLPEATALILVNQARADFGATGGDKLKPYGGYQQSHNISVSLKLNGGKVNDDRTGANLWGSVWKNSIAIPKGRGDTGILFGQGIDLGLDTLLAGVKFGFIDDRGSHYYLNGDKLGHGKPRAGETLMEMGFDDLHRFRSEIRDTIVAGKKEEEPDVETAE